MAKASIALSELVEKGAKDDVVRELLGHIVERLMATARQVTPYFLKSGFYGLSSGPFAD